MVTKRSGAITVQLTERERDALVGLVAAIANDGLDTYGLSPQEQAAVRRALGKLARETEMSESQPTERVVTYPLDAVRDLTERLGDYMRPEEAAEFAFHAVLDVVSAVDRLRAQERRANA